MLKSGTGNLTLQWGRDLLVAERGSQPLIGLAAW